MCGLKSKKQNKFKLPVPETNALWAMLKHTTHGVPVGIGFMHKPHAGWALDWFLSKKNVFLIDGFIKHFLHSNFTPYITSSRISWTFLKSEYH